MKYLIALALLLVPATAIAHDGGIQGDIAASGSMQGEIKASPTPRPTPADTGEDCDDAAGCAAPTKQPTATPGDCDDRDENCDRPAPTKKPSPTPCTDNDSDCDGRVAPSPIDQDDDGDLVDDSDERQTPNRDFGDRLRTLVDGRASFSVDFIVDESIRASASAALTEVAHEEDENVESVNVVSDSRISVRVGQRVKLFGVIPVRATAIVDVDADGRVDVYYPWWAFFARKDKDGLADSSFRIVSSLLARQHDRLMSIIGNLK